MNQRSLYLHKVKRIVIKIGSNSLTTNYAIDEKKIKKIVSLVTPLFEQYEIIIVSSGAISAGRRFLKLHRKLGSISEKQAAASVGQIELMELYKRYFNKNHITISQILLTEGDFSDRQKYLNARNALEVLIKHKIIPIINENDTVGISEIIFGDNDMLSALITILSDADLLIVLSDIDGLIDLKAKKILSFVDKIDESIFDLVHSKKTKEGRGGMESKLKAMNVIMEAGKIGVIANSQTDHIIKRIVQGENIGTFFVSHSFFSDRKSGKYKKKWIQYSGISKGKLYLDNGAIEALKKNKSLLATGVKKVEGLFHRGDVVTIYSLDKKEIGRGIINYNSVDVNKIIGLKSSEFEKVLSVKLNNELLHKDNIIIHRR